MSTQPAGFCIMCGQVIQSFDGLTSCPHCGTKSRPAGAPDQVTISINWQELRTLCIWAEQWQSLHKLSAVVYPIARRIADQHPDMPSLTMAGDIDVLRRAYGAANVQHNISGVEGASDLAGDIPSK